MALATSYSLGDRPSERGARESLDNTLRRTAVEQTPLFSLLPRGPKATAMYSEFLVDDLSAPQFPGVVDGKALNFSSDFTDKTTDRARLGNRIQQAERTFSVSPQAEAVSVAGPNDLYGASSARALIELKRDIEALIGSDNQQAVGSSSIGDLCGGLGSWTDPDNTSEYGGADQGVATQDDVDAGLADAIGDPIPTSAQANKRRYRSVAGSRFDLTTKGTMTENDFRALLQAVYENHGNSVSYKLVGGPSVINEIADMTRLNVTSGNNPAYQFTQNIGDGVLRLSVQEYISDWGRVFLVPSLLAGYTSGLQTLGDAQRNRAYLLPGDSYIQLRYLEDIKKIDLADVDGGGKRGLCRAMLTLTPTAGGKALGSIV
jgi:hypothetical protein